MTALCLIRSTINANKFLFLPKCFDKPRFFFFFDNSGIWAATFLTILPKGVQHPNGRDVKSVVAKTQTWVADSTAVPPLPPSYERLVNKPRYLPTLFSIPRVCLTRILFSSGVLAPKKDWWLTSIYHLTRCFLIL